MTMKPGVRSPRSSSGFLLGRLSFVSLILGVQGVLTSHWDTVASQSADLIKTAVPPIVTLVLGYYFGKGDKA